MKIMPLMKRLRILQSIHLILHRHKSLPTLLHCILLYAMNIHALSQTIPIPLLHIITMPTCLLLLTIMHTHLQAILLSIIHTLLYNTPIILLIITLHHTTIIPLLHHITIPPLLHHITIPPLLHHITIPPLLHHTTIFLPSCTTLLFLPSCTTLLFLPSCTTLLFLPSCTTLLPTPYCTSQPHTCFSLPQLPFPDGQFTKHPPLFVCCKASKCEGGTRRRSRWRVTVEEVQSDWVDFESVFEDYDSGPPLKIRKEVLDQCYQKASLRANLAMQLIKRKQFKEEEGNFKLCW